MSGSHTGFTGWIPAQAHWRDDLFDVDWCYLGRERFLEPFFEDTVARCVRDPFNQLFRHRTPINTLVERSVIEPGLPPTGFIFHMSRCGSTLVSQMLAALPQNIVISEADPIDSVIRANRIQPDLADVARIAWLQAVVAALGQTRQGDENHFFVKFDCWHTLDLALIRRAFPSVRWIFLYRDPVAVIASHLRQRGVQTVPGLIDPALFGIDRLAAMQMPAAEYCARVLAVITQAVLENLDDATLLVNYDQLPGAAMSTILEHFGVDFSEADRQIMSVAARNDSKTPSLRFDDSDRKLLAQADTARDFTETLIGPIYRQLEALRLSGGAAR